MKAKTRWLGTPVLALATIALLLAPAAAAQEGNDWTAGEDNEFGSIRGPYEVEAKSGKAAAVEYHITLNTHYDEQDTRYVMFMLSAQGTPLKLSIKSLQTKSGEEIEIYRKDGSNGVPKWSVDIRNMPPPGTPLVLKGTANSDEGGFWQMDAMVIPFDYMWEKARMSSGLDAKLQALTQVNAEGGGAGFCGEGGCGAGDAIKNVPGPVVLAPVGALMAAVAFGRRRGPDA